ncbi:MAG: hypothetical protein ABIG31_03275 [Candidatus Omnitrophota bacterium]
MSSLLLKPCYSSIAGVVRLPAGRQESLGVMRVTYFTHNAKRKTIRATQPIAA